MHRCSLRYVFFVRILSSSGFFSTRKKVLRSVHFRDLPADSTLKVHNSLAMIRRISAQAKCLPMQLLGPR